MIYLVVERWIRPDGSLEQDLLAGYEASPLIVRTLHGDEITRVLPTEHWTEARLNQVVRGIEAVFPEKVEQGADAYLADQWIGSTEV